MHKYAVYRPFSGMVPGTQTKRSALMMRNASLMNAFGNTSILLPSAVHLEERLTLSQSVS